jgi:Putative prokaryotic signal transducing protein
MTEFFEDPDKFVTVGKFLEPVNAQMAKGMLESAGIECFLQGENANSLLALAFRARLLVHKQDEEAARELLGGNGDELSAVELSHED